MNANILSEVRDDEHELAVSMVGTMDPEVPHFWIKAGVALLAIEGWDQFYALQNLLNETLSGVVGGPGNAEEAEELQNFLNDMLDGVDGGSGNADKENIPGPPPYNYIDSKGNKWILTGSGGSETSQTYAYRRVE